MPWAGAPLGFLSRRRRGGAALLAAAVLASACLAAAPDGADAPRAAHAQAPPAVKIGALMTNDPGQDFDDPDRTRVAQYAVEQFNLQNPGARLALEVTEIERGGEPGSLVGAYANGSGPLFYIGPTTSQGLVNIRGNAASSAVLDSVVLVSPSSEAPQLAIASDNIFRLAIDVGRQGRIMVGEMESAGIESYVAVYRDDAWGRQLESAVGEAANRSGIARADAVPFEPNRTAAYWRGIADGVEAAVSGRDGAGVFFMGYDDSYYDMARAANGSDTLRQNTAWFAVSGTVDASVRIGNATARNFSAAVGLTALDEAVARNGVTAAIDALLSKNATFYEYSTYDSVFVLGRAIAAAGGASANATAVAAAMQLAAAEHEGALGDVALDSRGDLRTPDRFVVRQVNSSGDWEDTGTAVSTPVFDVGALLILDGNPGYTDDLALAAMWAAVDDFNAGREAAGGFYIDLAVQRIRISPGYAPSPDPDALDGLRAAYANGSGPSLYVGPSTSENAARVLPYANANGIVLISPSSTAPSLAVPGDSLFRMAAPDSLRGIVLGDMISDRRSVTDLVVAVRNDSWGRGIDAATADRMGGDTSVTRVAFAEAGQNWTDVAARLDAGIAAASASAASRVGGGQAAVLFIGFDGDFAAVAEQADAFPRLGSVGWYGADGIRIDADSAAGRAAADLARMVDMRIVLDWAEPNDVTRRLGPPAADEPSAYDSVRVMGSAMAAARAAAGGGGPDPPAAADVKAAIPAAARAYSGALGNVTLDANGDLSSPSAYAVHRMGADGEWARARAVDAGGAARVDCSDGAVRCIEIPALHEAEYALITRLTHAAQMIAVDDYNREQAAAAAAGGAQRVHLSLQKVDVPVASPADGLGAAHAGGNGPAAYLGPQTSRAALALKPYIDANGIVLVSAASASQPAGLVQPDGLFRTSLNDRYEADLLVIAADLEGATTIIPVIRNDTYGHSYDDEIGVEGALLGMSVLEPAVVPSGTNNLSAMVGALNDRVEALGPGIDPSEVALIAAAFNTDVHNLAHYAIEYPALLSALWFNPGTLHAPNPIADPETLRLAQSASLSTTSWDLPQTERLERFRDSFRAETGRLPNQFVHASYDSVYLLADAINRSMLADGTYSADDVRASMHWAAERLDGLLGDNFEFDANGDRVSPSSVVIWRSTPGTGAWAEAGRIHLPATCRMSLGYDTIAFGDVRIGEPSGAVTQSLTSGGTEPMDTITIEAGPWAGAADLPAGATEARSAVAGLGGAGPGEWVRLDSAVTMGEPGGTTLPELSSVEFRVNAPAGAAPAGAAGSISQTVAYTVECLDTYAE